MDDDFDQGDDWLDRRLKAAARDAHMVPRTQFLLAAQAAAPRRTFGWVRRHRLVISLLALNAVTGSAAVAITLAVSTRGGQPPIRTPGPGVAALAPGDIKGTLRLDVVLPRDPTAARPLTVAFGSLWVSGAGAGTVVRVDERTLGVTATIAVDAPGATSFPSTATDGSAIWATAGSRHAVVRIDPATNRVVDTIDVGAPPDALAIDGDTLWVTTMSGLNQPGSLLELDANQHRVVRSFVVGTRPSRVHAAGGAIWVDNAGDGTLSRIDLATGRVATTRPNPADYDYGYVAMAADSTGAWAVDNNRSVLERVDGASLTSTRAIGVGLARAPTSGGSGPRDLFVDGDVGWVVTNAQLIRVDLRRSVTEAMDVPLARAVAVGDGAVWVLAGDATGSTLLKVEPRA